MQGLTTADLFFDFPQTLIATEPQTQFRAMLVEAKSQSPLEINNKAELWDYFSAGDVLVLNDTQVERRRVFCPNDIEILFLGPKTPISWDVLLPASRLGEKELPILPGPATCIHIERSMPQVLYLKDPLPHNYFEKYAQFALPPYIQKARGQRQTWQKDEEWYQSPWAENPGSCAAPTASLHFDHDDLEELTRRGVIIHKITLHVGFGTFEPIRSESIEEHHMHSEVFFVPEDTWSAIHYAKRNGARVWAMGTTVVRALESRSLGKINSTDLFLKPGDSFNVVSGLLTNFHQPGSSLLCLVGAFAGVEKTLAAYKWAVEKQFKLFSYGDLSVWLK